MRSTEIQNRIDNAKALDFGTIFSGSIELFKDVWVPGLVTMILNMVLAIPVVIVVYIPLVFLGIVGAYATSYDSYDPYAQSGFTPLMILALIFAYIFIIVAMSTITLALKAGFYRICKLKDLGEVGSEDYFYFFKKPYLGKTIKLALTIAGISLLATMMCVIPFLYVIVPLSYMVVFYAFNPDKSISDIIKLSFSLGNKKWLISFGLLIVSMFLALIVGFFMCLVGTYVTSSFSYLPTYLIYKDVVGFDEDENLPIVDGEVVF